MVYRLVSLASETLPALTFDTAQEAIAFAQANGLKARPEIIVDDSWLTRENTRYVTGEYESLPWMRLSWFANAESDSKRFAHVSKKDPTKVAFTESAEKGMRDIQTVIAPGRYLERFHGSSITSELLRDMAREYSTRLDTPPFKVARLSDDIVSVYQRGPNSCMSHSSDSYSGDAHPVSVYGLEHDDDVAPSALVLAYIEIDRRVTARALINERDKAFMRLYGDTDLLRKSLTKAGYEPRAPYGYSVRCIESDRGECVMPYIDAGPEGCFGAARVTLQNGRFLISESRGDTAGQTCGTLFEESDDDEDDYSNYCEYYDESTHDDVSPVIVDENGRTAWWSESAISNHATRIDGEYYSDELVSTDGNGDAFVTSGDTHSYCEGSHEYWPNDEMKECAESGEYFHESVMTEVKTSRDDTVWIADGALAAHSFTCLIDETVWHNDARHPDFVDVANIHAPTGEEIEERGIIRVNHFPHPDQLEMSLAA